MKRLFLAVYRFHVYRIILHLKNPQTITILCILGWNGEILLITVIKIEYVHSYSLNALLFQCLILIFKF